MINDVYYNKHHVPIYIHNRPSNKQESNYAREMSFSFHNTYYTEVVKMLYAHINIIILYNI